MGKYDSQDFLEREALLMPLITSVNIACGVHAEHPDLMRRTARLAAQNGTAIDAHPGFPHAGDFGRQDRRISPEEVESLVSTQLRTLTEVLTSDHLTLSHMKPHDGPNGTRPEDIPRSGLSSPQISLSPLNWLVAIPSPLPDPQLPRPMSHSASSVRCWMQPLRHDTALPDRFTKG
jgi:hypothetical protein